jgi:hypothetical protein
MKKFSKIAFIFFLFNIKLNTVLAGTLIAGEITYHNSSLYTFDFTITLYQASSHIDSTIQLLIESTYHTVSLSGSDTAGSMCGESISRNTYVFSHTYNGNGTYFVRVNCPNRHPNIKNIPNSANTSLSLEAYVNVNPFLGLNNSPVLMYPLIGQASLDTIFYSSLLMSDPEGDSISYQLMTPLANSGPIVGYTLPSASNTFSQDSISGLIIWDSPVTTGYYSVCVLIQEWRNGVIIGHTTREILIAVCQSSSIDDPINLYGDIRIISNPITDLLNIETSIQDNKTVKIFDSTGKLIFLNTFSGQEDQIDLSSFAKGVYILEIHNDSREANRRFIKL